MGRPRGKFDALLLSGQWGSRGRLVHGPTRGRSRAPRTFQSIPIVRLIKGLLFDGDCLHYLGRLRSDLVNTIFADPPFNLGKSYGRRTNDSLADQEYVEWCRRWLAECVRVLAPGGALFVYNLPRWSIVLGAYLMELPEMQFRHLIAMEMKSCLQIAGRLYPAHYSPPLFHQRKTKDFS